MNRFLLLTVLNVAGQPPLRLWYSEQHKIILSLTVYLSWKLLFSRIIIVFPQVEFMTLSKFVGAVSTSAAAAGVSSWVGINCVQ